MFIAFLYMFRATMCPSSGEITVPMKHLVFVTLYRWLPGMQGGMKNSKFERPNFLFQYFVARASLEERKLRVTRMRKG